MQTIEAIIDLVKRHIESNSLEQANQTARIGLRWYPQEARLHRLLGIVAGIEERHADARVEFLAAFELEGADVDAANLITSILALGDAKTAIGMMEDGAPLFSEEAVRIIAQSSREAIRIGALDRSALPPQIRTAIDELNLRGHR